MEKHEQVDDENIDYMATIDKHGEAAFLEKLSTFASEKNQKYTTMFARAAKRFKQEGIEQGRKEGMQKGMEQGRKEGMEEGIQKAALNWIHQLQKLGISQEIIVQAQKRMIENS